MTAEVESPNDQIPETRTLKSTLLALREEFGLRAVAIMVKQIADDEHRAVLNAIIPPYKIGSNEVFDETRANLIRRGARSLGLGSLRIKKERISMSIPKEGQPIEPRKMSFPPKEQPEQYDRGDGLDRDYLRE